MLVTQEFHFLLEINIVKRGWEEAVRGFGGRASHKRDSIWAVAGNLGREEISPEDARPIQSILRQASVKDREAGRAA